MFGTDVMVRCQSKLEIETFHSPSPISKSRFIADHIKSKYWSTAAPEGGKVLMVIAFFGNPSPPDLQLMKIFALLDINKVYGQNLAN